MEIFVRRSLNPILEMSTLHDTSGEGRTKRLIEAYPSIEMDPDESSIMRYNALEHIDISNRCLHCDAIRTESRTIFQLLFGFEKRTA